MTVMGLHVNLGVMRSGPEWAVLLAEPDLSNQWVQVPMGLCCDPVTLAMPVGKHLKILCVLEALAKDGFTSGLCMQMMLARGPG